MPEGPNPKIPFKNIKDKMPPDDDSVLLVWGKHHGYNVTDGKNFAAHYYFDLKLGLKPLMTDWLILEKSYDSKHQDTELPKPRRKRCSLI